MLSASDAVWDAVDVLPDSLKEYLTDDLGNEKPSYGGFLFPKNMTAIDVVNSMGYYSAFRGVAQSDVIYTDCTNAMPVEAIGRGLIFVGWDVVSGNGWVSASCRGVFPINPFDGNCRENGMNDVNPYGLIDDYEKCTAYAKSNNFINAGHAPWYPVSIFIDSTTLARLNSLRG